MSDGTRPIYGPDGQINWDAMADTPSPADQFDNHDGPLPLEARLPTPAKFVPANVRHYYRFHYDDQMFHRLPDIEEDEPIVSQLTHHMERRTRDPHFYLKTTIDEDGNRVTPEALRRQGVQ